MTKKKYTIDPPHKNKGSIPLFRVIYVTDVEANDAKMAAEKVSTMMQAEDSVKPVLVVLDSKGKQTTLDMSKIFEFSKITTGFVVQKYRNGVCMHQEFVAGDDVQFENLIGDSIKQPEHRYQPFNMILFSSSQVIEQLDEILSSIDVGGEQSRQFEMEISSLKSLIEELTPDSSAEKETAMRCNWCKKKVENDSIKWKGLLFCCDDCLDACRAAQ
jgi:hypothetical protein